MGSSFTRRTLAFLLLGLSLVFGQNCGPGYNFDVKPQNKAEQAQEVDRTPASTGKDLELDDIEDIDFSDADLIDTGWDVSGEVTSCLNALLKFNSRDLPRLTPGHTVINDLFGFENLGFYEELSLINDYTDPFRSFFNVSFVLGGYANRLRRMVGQNGITQLSFKTANLIEEQSGILCLGVEDRVAEIRNTDGVIVIVGTGNQRAVIDQLYKHRGIVILRNAKINSMDNSSFLVHQIR